MHIEYQISEDDFVSASRLAQRTRNLFARAQTYFFPAIGFVIIASGIISLFTGGPIKVLWPIILWGCFILCIPLLNKFQIRRIYRKTPLLQDRRTLDLDSSALRFATHNSDSRAPWETYTRFAENEETFILFQQGERIFIPIPKHELSPSQITELRSLFETHLARK
jgi:hypothetical protein